LIFDTAAVLNFGHRGDLPHLLSELSKHYAIFTTPGVVAELTDPKRKKFYDTFLAGHFTIQSDSAAFDLVTLSRLTRILDPGEITVLALAKELDGIAVLDETGARKQAPILGIKMTGTLGLMLEALKQKWMSDAQCIAHLRKLKEHGFWLPDLSPNQTFAAYMHSLNQLDQK
jgi:predicted nucleic acid-binding protein